MQKGIVIQTFGRFFAGLIDMNMCNGYKVHADHAGEPFKIKGVSPFSICGTPDSSMRKYAESGSTSYRVKADIRKNFDYICERAYCDYFVIDNTSALIGLANINGRYYSLMGGEKTDFINDYFNNNVEIKANYIRPVAEGFSERLRYQYDLFIDCVLRHYDAEHIILFRSHIPRFRSDNGAIAKTKHTENARVFLQQLDDYFAEKTGCATLDTPTRFFEARENWSNHVFLNGQEDLRIALEREIMSEIERPSLNHGARISSLVRRLRCDVVKTYNSVLLGIERNDKVTTTLDSLRSYWAMGTRTIADYVADGGSDIIHICDYFSYIDYSFDDIAALFQLFETSENKEDFTCIANNILSNIDGIAYQQSKSLFERNVKRLFAYEHNYISLEYVTFDGRIVIKLDDRHYLEICKNGLNTFSTVPTRKWDWREFVANNFVCGIEHLDDALECWEAYFERGRKNSTAPFVLEFTNESDFFDSLYFVDYCDVLENEFYIIRLRDTKAYYTNWEAKVDSAFLFDDRTFVTCVILGLADQMNTYLFAKDICLKNNMQLYLNDLSYDLDKLFAGMDLAEITKDDITHSRFSHIFSSRLRRRYRRLGTYTGYPILSNIRWHELGLEDHYFTVYMTPNLYERNKLDTIKVPVVLCKTMEQTEYFLAYKRKGLVNLFVTIKPWSRYELKDICEKIFGFESFNIDDTSNMDIMNTVAIYDIVSIHIRRGDRQSGGWGPVTQESHYKKALTFVFNDVKFGSDRSKFLLVFSDDINFVSENYKAYGIDVAGENVSFIDWNHHFNSYKDMQLMSFSRIIIRSMGGFAMCAAQISRTVEYVIQTDEQGVKIEYQRNKEKVNTLEV